MEIQARRQNFDEENMEDKPDDFRIGFYHPSDATN
jgi:hypothetical protein